MLDYLPPKWLAPVMEGALEMSEAAELWWLLTVQHPNEWIDPPPHLTDAVSRLELWQMGAGPTKH